MAVVPSIFGVCPQFVNEAGEPAVGDKLFFYVAGSNTKQNTYTDSTGNTANTNPIVLDALGQPSTELWWTSGDLYKVVWAPSTDTDPPTDPIRTWDNLSGINTASDAATQSEWVLYPAAPTYVSATSFTVTGNQTATFNVGRRVKTINSGGTIYSSITASVFGAVTTVTVINDSGVLDAGLSEVSYGLLSAINPSVPAIYARSGANNDITSLTALTAGGLPNNSVLTADIADGAVTPAKTQVGALPSMVRVNTSNGYGSTNTRTRRFLTVGTNQGSDITYADSVANGASFTKNTNGVYAITYGDCFSSATYCGLSINSSSGVTSIVALPVAEVLCVTTNGAADYAITASWAGYLAAGAVIRVQVNNASTVGTAGNAVQFTIVRVA